MHESTRRSVTPATVDKPGCADKRAPHRRGACDRIQELAGALTSRILGRKCSSRARSPFRWRARRAGDRVGAVARGGGGVNADGVSEEQLPRRRGTIKPQDAGARHRRRGAEHAEARELAPHHVGRRDDRSAAGAAHLGRCDRDTSGSRRALPRCSSRRSTSASTPT